MLSCVPMPQFGRLNMLNTSAIRSNERRLPSGIFCWTRKSGSVLRRREQIVARNDRPVRTEALAEVRARAADIAAVGVRQANPCGEEVERAQLEAVADLPDAVQHHPVALIVSRNSPTRRRDRAPWRTAPARDR